MGRTRLDPRLLKKLAQKIGKTEKYIREQIRKKAAKHQVSSEAYFVYWLTAKNIGAETYRRSLSSDIKDEIRSLQLFSTVSVNTAKRSKVQKIRKVEKIFQIKKLKIRPKPPILTQDIIDNAGRNTELYQCLFIFENSVRNIITSVLEDKYGSNWWRTEVNKKIRDNVSRRMREERLNPWRGTRGAEPIFYTDFSDLATILRSNAVDFNPIFKGVSGGLNWLTRRLDESTGIRHNIAHTSPLKSKDRDLFLLYFQNLYDMMDILNKRIK
jgi:hypothetical protein